MFLFILFVEFEQSFHTDSARKEQLLGSLAKEGHPMGKFMWGMLCLLLSCLMVKE